MNLELADFGRKLGIRSGHLVSLLNAPPFIAPVLRAALPPDVSLHVGLPQDGQPDVVLFWPDAGTDLARVFQDLRWKIKPDGAVWAVIPKKPVADSRGPRIYFDELLAQVLPTGLVDNKTLTFSQEEYGVRFVVRKELRRVPPPLEPGRAEGPA